MNAAHPPPPENTSHWLRTEYRLISIGLAVVLMAVTAYVLGTSWLAAQTTTALDPPHKSAESAAPARQHVEAGSLYSLELMRSYLASTPVAGKERTLATYYARRTFPGAPPWVPHDVENPMSTGGADCLQCHETGGYVPPMDAYAPVAPHPELTSCTQCHVPAQDTELFGQNEFVAAPPPALPEPAFDGGAPPPVPHEIVPQMRENWRRMSRGTGRAGGDSRGPPGAQRTACNAMCQPAPRRSGNARRPHHENDLTPVASPLPDPPAHSRRYGDDSLC
ncbi:MAG: hypothetical protein Q9O62_07625 [Ardenticatenia bacterium]|nr:hypothetical protein [Ardenticatenia bacterium]